MTAPFPVVGGYSPTLYLLGRRVAQLEQSLFLSLEILQVVLDRLSAKFGDDFFSDQTKIDLASTSEKAVLEVIDRIDDLLKNGQEGPAVRQFREEFHLTWDEAHGGLSEWKGLSREQKVRVLRLSRWMQSVSGSATP